MRTLGKVDKRVTSLPLFTFYLMGTSAAPDPLVSAHPGGRLPIDRHRTGGAGLFRGKVGGPGKGGQLNLTWRRPGRESAPRRTHGKENRPWNSSPGFSTPPASCPDDTEGAGPRS